MTTDLFMAYVEEMPRLRAQRQLDASDVALYPLLARFAPEAASAWRRGLAAIVAGDDETIADETPSLFRLNGVPMAPREMKLALGGALGAGFASEAA